MTHLPTAGVAEALGHASYAAEEAGMTFPAIFARFADSYFQKWGDHGRAMAQIAAN